MHVGGGGSEVQTQNSAIAAGATHIQDQQGILVMNFHEIEGRNLNRYLNPFLLLYFLSF